MRTQLASLFMVLGCALAACGGDDGGGSGIDAQGSTDAPVTSDAPPTELTGLGKKCVVAMQGADCPAEHGCLGPLTQGGTTGFCTKQCLTNASFMTNAQGQPGQETPTFASGDAMCTPLYSGSPGTAKCLMPFNFRPTPSGGSLAPNTTYMFDAACVIQATNGQCPAGTTAQAQTNYCFPT